MGEQLKKAGIHVPPQTERTPGRKPKQESARTGKTRAKTAHIIGLLTLHPKATDADIQRSIKLRFDEGVVNYIIAEARRIFHSQLAHGAIVVAGVRTYLHNVQRQFLQLTPQDQLAMFEWMQRGSDPEELRRFNESASQFSGRGGRVS